MSQGVLNVATFPVGWNPGRIIMDSPNSQSIKITVSVAPQKSNQKGSMQSHQKIVNPLAKPGQLFVSELLCLFTFLLLQGGGVEVYLLRSFTEKKALLDLINRELEKRISRPQKS